MALHKLKKLLPAAERHRFFNYAATSPMLRPCAERMKEIIQQGMEPLSLHLDQWIHLLESSRKAIADAIHASPEEIAFTTSTSSALSMAARSIRWNKNDKILYCCNDFPSNRFIWENLGVQAEGITLQDMMEHHLTGIRLVAISAVSYFDGTRCDIAKLVRKCREKNVLVVVDAIQAVGAIPVNVKEWDCDFLACGGQKWLLGPVGVGFLFINKRILSDLDVPYIGWASSKNAGFENEQLEFADGARRFEPGLPDIAAIAGLARNLEEFAKIGWENIFKQIERSSQYIFQRLQTLGYDIAAQEASSGIIAVNAISEQKAEEIYQECLRNDILLTKRKHFLRISCHAATSDQDIECLLKVFENYKKRPSKKHSKHFQHALITGASQGLGAAFAFALAERGCDLTLLGRNAKALSEKGELLRKQYAISVREVILDFAKPQEVANWLETDASDFDLIINNAVFANGSLFMDAPISEYQESLEVNFLAPLLITKKYLPQMLAKQTGSILNVATSGARFSLPFFSAYAASKAALWSWSEALGRELHNTGVHVMTFIPPNMPSATSYRLGRKALAYFNLMPRNRSVQPNQIAEQALNALLQKQQFFGSFSMKVKIALNALAPSYMSKRIRRLWKGL